MNPNIIEYVYQQTDSDERVWTVCDDNTKRFYYLEFTHLGQLWKSSVYITDGGDNVHVSLDMPRGAATTSVTYFGRITGRYSGTIFDLPVKCVDFERGGRVGNHRSGPNFCNEKFSKELFEGNFDLDIVFPVPAAVDRRCGDFVTLNDSIFKDVWVACSGFKNDKVFCNKSVIGRESEAMFSAFSNESSEESRTNTFTIRHPNATGEIVRLIVTAMYEGWLSEVMDEHAVDIFVIADCYRCEKIANYAIRTLKRQLSLDRFWEIASIAVVLRESRPALFECCVEYANVLPETVNQLLLRDDLANNETVVAVVVAVARLVKKIEEDAVED